MIIVFNDIYNYFLISNNYCMKIQIYFLIQKYNPPIYNYFNNKNDNNYLKTKKPYWQKHPKLVLKSKTIHKP